MSSSLPICAAFQYKWKGKYLRYNVEDGAGPSRQLLQFNGDDAANPYTRFYIEPSNKHDGFVHVRCCYNNKYWVAEQMSPNDDDEWWIAGSAHQPEEDLSLQSCTLFQLKPVGDDTDTFRLMHGRLGTYAAIPSAGSSADRANGAACLHVPSAAHLILVKLPERVLPKHVCFKGDNDLYLAAQPVGIRKFSTINKLIFCAEDMKDPAARHSTVTSSDGTATLIKSEGLGLFWRRTAAIAEDPWDWIFVDTTGDIPWERNQWFQAFLLNDDDDGEKTTDVVVCLLSIGRNLYCRRFTADNVTHCLAAMEEGDTRPPEMCIRLQEPVVSREITVVQFRFTQARFYDEEAELTLATATAYNNSSSPARVKLTFEITLTEKQRWSSSVTLRSPVTTTLSSEVPSKVDDSGGVVVTGLSSFNGMYSWGVTNVKTSRETVVQFVDLPPMTEVTATCQAKRSSYDVPFSYRQADKLIAGQDINMEFEDGIYSGQNFHSLVYNYETKLVAVT